MHPSTKLIDPRDALVWVLQALELEQVVQEEAVAPRPQVPGAEAQA